jgi:hypothetical protein
MERREGFRIIVPVFILIIGIWIGAWYVGMLSDFFLGKTEQPIADTFNSVNALFAGLAFGGVIITIYLQMRELQETREELKKTAEANAEMARASNERAVLELFKTYCSDYFQKIKDESMSVLIPCVASKDYYEFVVSRFFVSEQKPFPETCWDDISGANASYCSSLEDFKVNEQRYRYKLDELISFFSVLVGREDSSEVIGRCDFSYSWWRPLFWMIASGQEKRYQDFESIRKYATPLYFRSVVEKLDEIYGFAPFSSDREMWIYILGHPKVMGYGVDEKYRSFIG